MVNCDIIILHSVCRGVSAQSNENSQINKRKVNIKKCGSTLSLRFFIFNYSKISMFKRKRSAIIIDLASPTSNTRLVPFPVVADNRYITISATCRQKLNARKPL